MSDRIPVRVAVGVVVNEHDEVLISRRHVDSHQGGLWEFPGGKIEAGESVESALQREFREELGIEVGTAYPFKQILHDYGDKSVCLEIWRIVDYRGRPQGLEGQPVEWCPVSKLQNRPFPAANVPISRALAIPFFMAITPQLNSPEALPDLLDHYVNQGVRLVQLRQKHLDAQGYEQWFERAMTHLENSGTNLLFNHDGARPASADIALHVSAAKLATLSQRPVSDAALFGVSCHNTGEMQQALALGADFVTLSPVQATAKYEAAQLLGWDGFSNLRRQISLPVFALGGLNRADRKAAIAAGANGIASISAFLP